MNEQKKICFYVRLERKNLGYNKIIDIHFNNIVIMHLKHSGNANYFNSNELRRTGKPLAISPEYYNNNIAVSVLLIKFEKKCYIRKQLFIRHCSIIELSRHRVATSSSYRGDELSRCQVVVVVEFPFSKCPFGSRTD